MAALMKPKGFIGDVAAIGWRSFNEEIGWSPSLNGIKTVYALNVLRISFCVTHHQIFIFLGTLAGSVILRGSMLQSDSANESNASIPQSFSVEEARQNVY
jgi:ABC-type xylose transport system permease subunit